MKHRNSFCIGIVASLLAMASHTAISAEAASSEDADVCKWLLDRAMDADKRATEARKDVVTKADYVEKIALLVQRAPVRSNATAQDGTSIELTYARQSLDIAAAISAASDASSSSALTAYIVHCPKQFSARIKANISQRSPSDSK